MKPGLSGHIFEKSSNTKFHDNPSSKNRVVPYIQTDRQMDRHDEVIPLTPNDPYRGRTAPLNSKVAFYIFIQQI